MAGRGDVRVIMKAKLQPKGNHARCGQVAGQTGQTFADGLHRKEPEVTL